MNNIEDYLATAAWIVLNGWMVRYQLRLLRLTRLALPKLHGPALAIAKVRQVSLRWRFSAILADLILGLLSIDPQIIGGLYGQLFLIVFLYGAFVLLRNSRADYQEIVRMVNEETSE